MPDWRPALSSRLARLALRPAREREIIDELSQHLDDRYQELRNDGVSHEEAMRLAIDEIDGDAGLVRGMRTLRQAATREPIVAGAPSRGLFSDAWKDLEEVPVVGRPAEGQQEVVVFGRAGAKDHATNY